MANAQVRPSLEELRTRQSDILRIAAAHGVRSVVVFGSFARDEAGPDSDVDLLIEMEPGRNVLDLSEFVLDLQEALGRPVDVVELGCPSRLADRIRREAVAL